MPAGRPDHSPTLKDRRTVEALKAFGMTEEQICYVMRLDEKTLRKHYRFELDTGWIKMVSALGQSLYRTAMKGGAGSVEAAKFLLSRRGGPAWAVQIAEAQAGYVSKKEEAQWAAKRAGLGSEWDQDLISTPQASAAVN